METFNINPNEIDIFLGYYTKEEDQFAAIPIVYGKKSSKSADADDLDDLDFLDTSNTGSDITGSSDPTGSSNPVSDEPESTENDVFVIQLSNIKLGQTVHTESITIEGCEFIEEEETYPGILGYKIFKDLRTNKKVRIDIYMNNPVSHDFDETILSDFRYITNHTDSDILNIRCKVFQDGVDLSNRKITYTHDNDPLIANIKAFYNSNTVKELSNVTSFDIEIKKVP